MAQRRTIVTEVAATARSERRACRWLGVSRSGVRYPAQRPARDQALRARLRELASEHPRWGWPMLHWRLHQEGLHVNHTRVRRLYRLEGLAVRRQRRKRVARPRVALPPPTAPNRRWSMDFVHDCCADGRAFRAFTLVDDFTRECPVIEVDRRLGSERVVAVLTRLAQTRGLPTTISLDNGPEFQSKALDAWAFQHGVQLQFIRPGKPVENAFIESFNSRFRDECLNQHWFRTLPEAQACIERWRQHYNTARPHRGLGRRTPAAFAALYQEGSTTTRLSA
jgi:putative transposase